MQLNVPILLIEDDYDDAVLIADAVQELGVPHPVKHFATAVEAYEYLLVTTDKPLVILCDVKMPGLNGLSLLKNIIANEFLKKKAIPFVFLTALETKEVIDEAYYLGVQGYFLKSRSYQGLKDQLLSVLVYWRASLHPNTPRL